MPVVPVLAGSRGKLCGCFVVLLSLLGTTAWEHPRGYSAESTLAGREGIFLTVFFFMFASNYYTAAVITQPSTSAPFMAFVLDPPSPRNHTLSFPSAMSTRRLYPIL